MLPFVLLSPFKSRAITDPTNWLMCEKFDGVRVAWFNGEFFTRNGNRIQCPSWYSETLPVTDVAIDGELFMGRGRFQDLMTIINRPKRFTDLVWKSIWFVGFDLQILNVPFVDRYARLKTLARPDSYFRVIKCAQVLSIGSIQKYLEEVTGQNGGEGIVLRAKHGLYVSRRSTENMKLKRPQVTSAQVVAVSRTSLNDTVVLTVSHGDTKSRVTVPRAVNIPKVGDVVNVRHLGFTQGNMSFRFASLASS
jgi:DNA ligase-1